MVKLVTAGQQSDLTNGLPIKEIVLNWLKANWDDTNPNIPDSTDIIWGLWWTDTFGLHIHVTEVNTMMSYQTLGTMPMIGFTSRVTIDLFSRQTDTESTELPADLAGAIAFIEELIAKDETGLASSGIQAIQLWRSMEQLEQDPTSSARHYAIDCSLYYAKAVINS